MNVLLIPPLSTPGLALIGGGTRSGFGANAGLTFDVVCCGGNDGSGSALLPVVASVLALLSALAAL
jgi:hypothetical protein